MCRKKVMYQCEFCAQEYRENQILALECEITHMKGLIQTAQGQKDTLWEKSLNENIRTHTEKIERIAQDKQILGKTS